MGSSHEGVLTSLLNEMDGVQELTGVTVVAATNRPDAIVSYHATHYPRPIIMPYSGLRADASRKT